MEAGVRRPHEKLSIERGDIVEDVFESHQFLFSCGPMAETFLWSRYQEMLWLFLVWCILGAVQTLSLKSRACLRAR